MYRYFFLALLFSSFPALAQPPDFYFIRKNDSTIRINSRIERYLGLLDENTIIEGSMYLNDDFAPGMILLRNHRLVDNLFIRYNVFRDQMEMVVKNDTVILAHPSETRWLGIGRNRYCWLPYSKKDTVAHGYFEVAVEGNYRLLVRRVALFEPANPPYTLLQLGNEYDRFVQVESFFVQSGEAPAQKLRRSGRFFASMFADDHQKIRAYIKANNLNLRKREDLVQLIRYCNTLSEHDTILSQSNR